MLETAILSGAYILLVVSIVGSVTCKKPSERIGSLLHGVLIIGLLYLFWSK